MKTGKRAAAVALMLALLMGVTACGSVQTEDQTKIEKENKVQIGMSLG